MATTRGLTIGFTEIPCQRTPTFIAGSQRIRDVSAGASATTARVSGGMLVRDAWLTCRDGSCNHIESPSPPVVHLRSRERTSRPCLTFRRRRSVEIFRRNLLTAAALRSPMAWPLTVDAITAHPRVCSAGLVTTCLHRTDEVCCAADTRPREGCHMLPPPSHRAGALAPCRRGICPLLHCQRPHHPPLACHVTMHSSSGSKSNRPWTNAHHQKQGPRALHVFGAWKLSTDFQKRVIRMMEIRNFEKKKKTL
ncbi:hypothetical protein FN846DRAFT_487518 [Sphaerosporella brunnea]|uniref:Uncharacterized protein n=1 Tax=Sphaerosporella brunnea TaxID=1250544 RepID=A0A5J5F4F2_9PEZI|nr:hypothetical protein FN846DRAFT_487518 [Sphaerosporella brunnea]